MEATGLALGVLGLIKPLASALNDTINNERSYGSDAEKLRVRCSAQQKRLESLECVLFNPEKFPFVNGRIWDYLPELVRGDIVGMLRQLYVLLGEYLAVKKKYELEPPQLQHTLESLFGSGDEPEVVDRRRQLVVSSGKEADAKSQRSASWAKRMRWAIWDKKGAQRIVEEFEEWNERLRQMIETVWWPLPFFSTSAQLLILEQDQDASTAGLLGSISLRRLLVPDAKPNGEAIKTLNIPRDQFHPQETFQSLTTGTIVGQEGFAMVEYKEYEPNGDGSIDTVVTKRIRQLALLLHDQDDPRFKVLRCAAFFNDRANNRFGFAFSIPDDLKPQPISLSTQLLVKGIRPNLGARLKLAHALAESLQLLHSVGWIHKSLRSENIVLFPPKNLQADNTTTSDEVLRHYRPTLFGFEYSRPESGFSSRRTDKDIVRNLYRHPARWWLPEERFSKIHDIYGTGLSHPHYSWPLTSS